jgi:hypothetical protein
LIGLGGGWTFREVPGVEICGVVGMYLAVRSHYCSCYNVMLNRLSKIKIYHQEEDYSIPITYVLLPADWESLRDILLRWE